MLSVHTKKLGSVAILNLQGQIVNGQTEILRDSFESLNGVSAVKLDFSRVNTVDAGGLGVMLQLREQAEAQGIRLEIMNLSKQIRRVFEITRLDSVFRITGGIQFFPATSRNRHIPSAPMASCA